MIDKKHKDYSVEDLLDDPEFVSIANNSTENELDQFINSNSESKINILKARKIIRLFKTNEGHLEEVRKNILFQSINHFNKEQFKILL